LGLMDGALRLPMTELSEQHQTMVSEALKNAGINIG
jgi:hypothetical protein